MKSKILSLFLLSSVSLMFFSCSSNKASVVEETEVLEEITGPVNSVIQDNQTWVLQKIDGVDAKSVFDNLPTLSFDVIKKRISGNSGCNRYSGAYILDDENNLEIKQVLTTRMLCGNKNNEPGFITDLEDVTSVKMVNNNTLVFMNGDNSLLEFVPQ